MRGWIRARWRSVAVMATAVLVTGALLVGGVMAQTPPAQGQTNGNSLFTTFVSKLAGRLGVPQDKVQREITATQKEMIDEAAQVGRLTPDAANKLKQQADAGRFVLPRTQRGAGGPGKPGFGPGPLKEAADCLKLDPPALMTQLQAGKSLAEVAAAQTPAIARADLITCLTTKTQARLAQAVTDKKLTQAQADQALQRFKDNVDRLIDHKGAAGPVGRGPGRFGPGGPGVPGGPGAPRGPLGVAAPSLMQSAADCLKLDPTALMTQLRAGKSLAEVAAAQTPAIARADLITCLTTKTQARLAQAVTDKKLTQAQADQALQRFKDNVGQMIDRKFQAGARPGQTPRNGAPAPRAPQGQGSV